MVKEKEQFFIEWIGEEFYSKDDRAISLANNKNYGEFKEGREIYSQVEVLFLVEKNTALLRKSKKIIKFRELIDKLSKKDKKVNINLLVFKDLRGRGYILKTALKFGADFRVYERNQKPGEEHAKWILYCIKESDVLRWQDFAAKNRVAHSTKKKLLVAIVDEENDITYYEVKWLRP